MSRSGRTASLARCRKEAESLNAAAMLRRARPWHTCAEPRRQGHGSAHHRPLRRCRGEACLVTHHGISCRTSQKLKQASRGERRTTVLRLEHNRNIILPSKPWVHAKEGAVNAPGSNFESRRIPALLGSFVGNAVEIEAATKKARPVRQQCSTLRNLATRSQAMRCLRSNRMNTGRIIRPRRKFVTASRIRLCA